MLTECPACNYDLTGSAARTCPECGADLRALEAKLDESRRERPEPRPDEALPDSAEDHDFEFFGVFGGSTLAAAGAFVGGIYLTSVSAPRGDGRGTLMGVGWLAIAIGHVVVMRQRYRHDTRLIAREPGRLQTAFVMCLWSATVGWLLVTLAVVSN